MTAQLFGDGPTLDAAGMAGGRLQHKCVALFHTHAGAYTSRPTGTVAAHQQQQALVETHVNTTKQKWTRIFTQDNTGAHTEGDTSTQQTHLLFLEVRE
jgi:hypothetical protein